jgi:ABC-type sugar transport system permease subunit
MTAIKLIFVGLKNTINILNNIRGTFNFQAFILFAVVMLFGIFIASVLTSMFGLDSSSLTGVFIQFVIAAFIVFYLWEHYLRGKARE